MPFGSLALERPLLLLRIAVAIGLSAVPLSSLAQAGSNPTEAYTRAVTQPAGPSRISALEDLLSRAPGAHKADALEVLVWDYSRAGNQRQAVTAARELLGADPGNPIAVAVLAQAQAGSEEKKSTKPLSTQDEIRALQNLQRSSKPSGISDAESMTMYRQAYAILSGAIGSAFLTQRDYEQARAYLRNAVAVEPDNAQYVYSLALADLGGDKPNEKEGYWSLGRAVVLTQGTSGGQQIAEYAQKSYKSAGGSDADWSRFLAAARTPSSIGAQTNETTVASAATATKQASATTSPRQDETADGSKPADNGSNRKVAEEQKPKKPAKEKKEKEQKEKDDKREEERVEASIWKPATPEPEIIRPEPKRIPFPPGEPVSLGILIEASDASKNTKAAIVQGLSDIVRRLRPNDEAFILAFSDQLMFEQDLTQNYRLLEQAIDNIKPGSGTALYEAVGFASGHLKRVARNRNQALLVISDGRNSGSKDSSLRLASEISNVRVYCIGMDVDAPENRNTLQILAGRSGGEATFISAAGEFENAAQQLAQVIYGPGQTSRAR